MTEQAPAATEATAKRPSFVVQRLYAKDISFEAPGTPGIFTQAWEPETNIQFSSAAGRVGESVFEVVLQMTVKATLKEKVAYIAEARFAGVFQIEGVEGPALEHVLGAQCPTILFPYVRELIGDLISRGSFPQLVLQPMNFEAIYADAKRRREQEGAANAAAAAAAPKH